MTNTTMHSLRLRRPALGPWAVGWLMLMIGGSVVGMAANLVILADGATTARLVLPQFTAGLAALLIAFGAVTCAGAAILLLCRRRIGLYLIAGAALGALAVNFWIGVPPWRSAVGLLGPLIAWAFVRPRSHVLT